MSPEERKALVLAHATADDAATFEEGYAILQDAVIELLAARSQGHTEGWRLVPVEPAVEMLNAAVDATGAGSGMSWNGMSPQSLFERGYRAMLAAAPAPPSSTEGVRS